MNWLDIVILIILGGGFIKGLCDGLVKQFIGLVALVLAFIFSGMFAKVIRNVVEVLWQWEFSFSPATMNVIYYILAFAIILFVFGLLAELIHKVINYTPVGVLNRLGGAAFGFIIWLLCLSFVLNLMAVFDVESKIIPEETQEKSIAYTPVKMTLPVVYPYIREFFY